MAPTVHHLRSLPVIQIYYLLTPVFVAVDLMGGGPVRVAGLGDSAWRLAYYGLLVVLALVCRVRPGLAPAVGMTESAVNLLLLTRRS